MSGVSRNSISNLERNENNNGQAVDPRLSTVYNLAQALNVPPVALLPAAGREVKSICVDNSLAIDIRWPSTEEETLFDADLTVLKPRSAPAQDAADAKARVRPAVPGNELRSSTPDER